MKSVANQRLCGDTMMETELKIWLDEGELARLQPAARARRISGRAEPRTETLVSVYYDTADQALAAAGVSLRLRRVGRRWVRDDQAPERRTRRRTASSRTSRRELPAPGGRLVLAGPDPDGALAAVREAAGDAPLAPVFETRVRRMVERLAAPGGGEVELALDEGEIVAGEARAPIREAGARARLGRGRRALRAGAAALPHRSGPLRPGEQGRARLPAGADGRGGRAGEAAQRRRAELRARRRRWRRRRATSCATASGRSPSTWPWWPTAPRSRGRTSSASGCAGCRTAFAVFGPSLGKAAMAPLADDGAAARAGGGGAARRRRADERGGGRRGAAAGSTRRRAARSTRRWRRAATGCARRCARRWRAPEATALPLRSRRLHRGARLAGRVRLFPDRAAGGADRRGGAGHPRPPAPQGDEARAARCASSTPPACTSCARS